MTQIRAFQPMAASSHNCRAHDLDGSCRRLARYVTSLVFACLSIFGCGCASINMGEKYGDPEVSRTEVMDLESVESVDPVLYTVKDKISLVLVAQSRQSDKEVITKKQDRYIKRLALGLWPGALSFETAKKRISGVILIPIGSCYIYPVIRSLFVEPFRGYKLRSRLDSPFAHDAAKW